MEKETNTAGQMDHMHAGDDQQAGDRARRDDRVQREDTAKLLAVVEAIRGHEPDITESKLQSILYYIQAWSLATTGDPIFNEKPYAHPDGPKYRGLEKMLAEGEGAMGRENVEDNPDTTTHHR